MPYVQDGTMWYGALDLQHNLCLDRVCGMFGVHNFENMLLNAYQNQGLVLSVYGLGYDMSMSKTWARR